MDITEIYRLFPNEVDCLSHLEMVRWNDSPCCPYCQSPNATPMRKENRYHCNNCNTSYSVTVGTIFHHSHLPLQKWFLALCLILNARKGISARQLARDLRVNKNTAWRMEMKIREAMSQHKQRTLLTGIVEMDETYVGGKPRRGDGIKRKRGRGTPKTPVVGMAERKGKVKVKVFSKKDLNSKKLMFLVRKNVDTKNAILITDEYKGYLGMKRLMPHKVVDHTIWYVDGDKHTNTVESFWAILKRGIIGQFHKVSLYYLPKYIDEFCYRYNYRNEPNLFGLTLQRAMGVM